MKKALLVKSDHYGRGIVTAVNKILDILASDAEIDIISFSEFTHKYSLDDMDILMFQLESTYEFFGPIGRLTKKEDKIFVDIFKGMEKYFNKTISNVGNKNE